MDTVMVGEWHGVPQGHLGCPNQEGGPRLIRFESPRWRPKETQVRVHLGVQEQPAPKSTPRPHTESILDALYMDGKIISRSFQWNWFEAQIHSESTGIAKTSGASNGAGLRPKFIRSRRESPKQVNV